MLRERPIKKHSAVGCVVPAFFNGDYFASSQSVVIPSHDEYNIGDLIEAGVKVSPVSTDIIHDDGAVNALVSEMSDN
jgi:hypothetical protein